MRSFFFTLSLLPAIALIGCAAPTQEILGNAQQVQGEGTLLIYSRTPIYVKNPSDAKDDLGKEDAKTVQDSLLSYMTSRAKKFGFTSVRWIVNPDLKDSTLTIEKGDTFNYSYLANDTNKEVRIYLTQPYTSRELVQGRAYNPVMAQTMPNSATGAATGYVQTQTKFLYISSHYILQDKHGQIASYGQATGKSAFSFMMTEGDWKSATQDMFKQIFKGTSVGFKF